MEKPAFLIALEGRRRRMSAPPFNVGLQRDRARPLVCVVCSRAKLGLQGSPNRGEIGYPADRAMVVVEGATPCDLCPGRNHHDRHRRSSQYRRARPVRPGLFTLAIYALPVFVGLTRRSIQFKLEQDPFGAIIVGFVADGTTLVSGQCAVSVALLHRPLSRWIAIGACCDTCRP